MILLFYNPIFLIYKLVYHDFLGLTLILCPFSGIHFLAVSGILSFNSGKNRSTQFFILFPSHTSVGCPKITLLRISESIMLSVVEYSSLTPMAGKLLNGFGSHLQSFSYVHYSYYSKARYL